MIVCVLDTEHINAMVKALNESKVFHIRKTSETLIATHIATGKEVLRSLRGNSGWLTRHHKMLFAKS